MINTNLIYSFSQTVIDSSAGKSKKSLPERKRGGDDNLIVEEYEGTCEECEKALKKPACPVCLE